jgi:hypothetical protein
VGQFTLGGVQNQVGKFLHVENFSELHHASSHLSFCYLNDFEGRFCNFSGIILQNLAFWKQVLILTDMPLFL